jgi:hypothetical protein
MYRCMVVAAGRAGVGVVRCAAPVGGVSAIKRAALRAAPLGAARALSLSPLSFDDNDEDAESNRLAAAKKSARALLAPLSFDDYEVDTASSRRAATNAASSKRAPPKGRPAFDGEGNVGDDGDGPIARKAVNSLVDNATSLDEFDLDSKVRRNLEQSGITSLFPVQAQTFEIVRNNQDLIAKSPTGSGKTMAFVLPVVNEMLKVGVAGGCGGCGGAVAAVAAVAAGVAGVAVVAAVAPGVRTREFVCVSAFSCRLLFLCYWQQPARSLCPQMMQTKLACERGALPKCLVLAPTRELSNQTGREFDRVTRGTGIRTTTIYGGVPYPGQRKALQDGVEVVVGTPGRIMDLLKDGALCLDEVGRQ